MLISELQDRLRELLSVRIGAGELTGTELANRAGFQQAHISNFLNARRGLSIEAMDRVMQALGLEVRDLMPALRAASGSEAGFELVPLVTPAALMQRAFSSGDIVDTMKFKRSFLRRLRPEMASAREGWVRFVLIKAEKDVAAMRPRLQPGALLLIDRHYNALRGYRPHEPNVYVVRSGQEWKVRYVELQGRQLLLRPEHQGSPLGYLALGKGESFTEHVVGRVAHAACEM